MLGFLDFEEGLLFGSCDFGFGEVVLLLADRLLEAELIFSKTTKTSGRKI